MNKRYDIIKLLESKRSCCASVNKIYSCGAIKMYNQTSIRKVHFENAKMFSTNHSPLLVFQNLLSYTILLFVISPYEQFIPNSIYVLLVIIWFLLTAKIDFNGLYIAFVGVKEKNWLIYSWIIYLLIESVIKNSQFPMKVLMTIFCLQMFWYYFDKIKILKRQLCFVAVYLLVILGNSVLKLIENPLISRELAGASFEHAGVFMAGYTIVYSCVFLIPFLYFIVFAKNDLKNSERILTLTVFVMGSILLVMAQYSIALILSLGLLIIQHFLFAKKSVRLNTMLIVLLIVLFSVLIIIPLIENSLSNTIGNKFEFLNSRYNQLKSYLFDRDHNSDVLGIRPTLYRNSFDTFKENPIWGVGRNVQDKDIVGEHSEILDLLARHGLLGALFYFLSFGRNASRIVKNQKDKNTKMSILVTYLVFFVFLFVNPGLRLADGIALFYLIPAISRVTEEDTRSNHLWDFRVNVDL